MERLRKEIFCFFYLQVEIVGNQEETCIARFPPLSLHFLLLIESVLTHILILYNNSFGTKASSLFSPV